MTLMPSSEYTNKHQKKIRKTIYTKRENDYDGYILYHELDGTFSNGWKYKDGEIVASIQQMDKTNEKNNNTTGLLKIWSLESSYQLAPQPKKLRRQKTKSSETDDDDTKDGGVLSELVITADMPTGIGTTPNVGIDDATIRYYQEIYGNRGSDNNTNSSLNQPNSSVGDINGGYHKGGNGRGTGRKKPKTQKNIDDLPTKRPEVVLLDCNSVFTRMKQDMYTDYNFLTNFKGRKLPENKKTPSFQDYLNVIKANPNYEHSLTLAYADEEYYTYDIISGSEKNKTEKRDSPYTIANIHNHPNNTPPSSQDIKTALNSAKEAINYKAFYTMMADSTVYAFRVTDRDKLVQFMKDYGEQMTIDTTTNKFTNKSGFDKAWKNGMDKFKRLGVTTAWEYTIAYLFEKYSMGLTLLKKEKGSNAFKVQYLRKGDKDKYELVKCE